MIAPGVVAVLGVAFGHLDAGEPERDLGPLAGQLRRLQRHPRPSQQRDHFADL